MEKLIKKINKVLVTNFHGCEVELELNSAHRVSGFLMWTGFKRFDQVDRQERLWKVLDVNLTDSERHKITAIFTMTPDEMAVAREG